MSSTKKTCKGSINEWLSYWKATRMIFENKSITDEKAKKLIDEALAIDRAEAN